jgi:hypothetical protein
MRLPWRGRPLDHAGGAARTGPIPGGYGGAMVVLLLVAGAR